MGRSGQAIVMANVTTAAGLMSFSTADVAPIADLVIFAGIGVLLAFFYTVTLLPALLAVVPLKKNPLLATSATGGIMDWLLSGVARFSTTHPLAILIVSSVIIAGSIFAVTGIRFSHYSLVWFHLENSIRVVKDFLNDTLTFTLLAMTYGPLGQDGAFQRLQVDYDLRDNVEITGGVVLYQSGDLPEFRSIGDNDRIFGEVAYHF